MSGLIRDTLKCVAVIVVTAALAFLLHIGAIYTPWKVGYWGKYNQVRAVIAQIDGLQIIDTWTHQDITLEDFGFTVVDRAGRRWQLDFHENSPQMRLRTDEEIARYIRSHLATPDT